MLTLRRNLSLLFCLAMAATVSVLATDYFAADGIQWIDVTRVALLAASTAWLAWGASLALNGLLSLGNGAAKTPGNTALPTARTAVLVPVYNEDPTKTFSHVAAMAESLKAQGIQESFHIAILSDTRNDRIAEDEQYWLGRLRMEVGAEIPIFYRRREDNTGKKAGNIADFIRTSGALYDYLVILDADSLMEGATMIEMVRRMEANPTLGLLQTLPKIVHARSFFGRAIQFATAYYSPVFARGQAEMQGDAGPFWGHNAIVRTRAFAQSCGLPTLRGKPPFGGHILSHDYVEAALLTRNGWAVHVAPDIQGSFEEGPDNVIDFAKRDRRWCQGNLQHARVMGAPGLKPWSRFVFLQNILAYVTSPLWALFIVASIAAPALKTIPDYFPAPSLFPAFPRVEQALALTLLIGVFGLLIGPKLLIVARGAFTGRNRHFGGTLRCLGNVIVEVVSSSLLAPLMLLYQCRAVGQVLLGADGGWPATDREAGAVPFGEAWTASWWISATGLLTLAATFKFAPAYLPWVSLVAAPQVIAPLLIYLTSRSVGRLGILGLFATPREIRPAPVVAHQEAVLARWRVESTPKRPDASLSPAAALATAELERP